MIKKTVKFTDYNGEEVTQDVYFNLTQTELTKMQITDKGSLARYIEKIQNERDNKKLLELFDEMILNAYGEKDSTGKFFMKTDEIRTKFKCSPMYDEIFMECVGDVDKAVAFIKGVLPKDLQDKIDKENVTATVEALNATNTDS